MYLVSLVPEELNRWTQLPPPLSWRGEKRRKGFLLMPHQMTGSPSAAKLGPGEAETTVPSTALGVLLFQISQDTGQSASEQTKEKSPNAA